MDLNSTRDLWPLLHRGSERPQTEVYRRCFDFLLANQAYSDAQSLWCKIARDFYQCDWDPSSQVLWNPSFDLPLTFPGGLEWRIGSPLPKGVRIEVKGAREPIVRNALWISFAGEENVTFSHIRHGFFVQPGRSYRLRYKASPHKITTANGPYVQVTVPGKSPIRQRGPVITGSEPCEETLEFTVPEDRQWAELAICRDHSTMFNNKIRGEIEFSDFAVTLK